MQRDPLLQRLNEPHGPWDVLVIGGGATGLGSAIDAAARGYRTVLVEQHDFAKGTSSRSTKLVHGGVRYLQQGNVSLVLEALEERGLLHKNAPQLVGELPFVVPNYDWWEAPFYGIGLRLYDILAGRHGFGASKLLSKAETLERLPTIETNGLRGGVLYYDGQFDDARLAITMARTAVDLGATVVNYVRVSGLLKEDGVVTGVRAIDEESGRELEIEARVTVNATGAFSDGVRRMDDPEAGSMIRPSQGVHLVLPRRFLPGSSAIMVPHTDDGRVLFAIPWHDCAVIGTTDTPIPEAVLEPRPQQEELDFLLTHAARYLSEDPTPGDVLSVFVGIRPLVGSLDEADSKTISRDHTLHISGSGLVTIAGGKWTTYRKMAQDTIDQAAMVGGLEKRDCTTHELRLHGYQQGAERFGDLALYGSDAPSILDLVRQDPALDQKVHPSLRPRRVEVKWAVQHEMARSVEDFLARRSRSQLLDARASIEAAPAVAAQMAELLGQDSSWIAEQVGRYETLTRQYLIAE